MVYIRNLFQVIEPHISAQNQVQVTVPRILAIVVAEGSTSLDVSMPCIRD
jgi:hypothetical protein